MTEHSIADSKTPRREVTTFVTCCLQTEDNRYSFRVAFIELRVRRSTGTHGWLAVSPSPRPSCVLPHPSRHDTRATPLLLPVVYHYSHLHAVPDLTPLCTHTDRPTDARIIIWAPWADVLLQGACALGDWGPARTIIHSHSHSQIHSSPSKPAPQHVSSPLRPCRRVDLCSQHCFPPTTILKPNTLAHNNDDWTRQARDRRSASYFELGLWPELAPVPSPPCLLPPLFTSVPSGPALRPIDALALQTILLCSTAGGQHASPPSSFSRASPAGK